MGKCFENDVIFPIISRIIRQIAQEKRAGTYKAPAERSRAHDEGGIKMPLFGSRAMSASSPDYVLHGEIVARLLTDASGRREVQDACRRCPAHTEEWMANNMVKWWSQTITEQRNLYARGFDRVKLNGVWAYRPKARS